MYTSTVLQYRVYMVCSTRSRPPSGTSLNVNLQKMNVISVTVGPLWRRVRLVVRSVDFSAFAVVRFTDTCMQVQVPSSSQGTYL